MINFRMSDQYLSEPARFRMIRLYISLNRLDDSWNYTVLTSAELAERIQSTAEVVRKDLNALGCGSEGRGYKVGSLRQGLYKTLHLHGSLKTGLIGLDWWGAILIREENIIPGLRITAAFDGNQNRLERTETKISLYPAFEIRDVFEREGIEIGILASENAQPERNLDRMLKAGVKGIINLTSVPLTVPEGVFYYQADLYLGLLSLISRINGSE